MKKLLIFMLCAALVFSNLEVVPLWADDDPAGEGTTEMVSQGDGQDYDDDGSDGEGGGDETDPPQEDPPEEDPPQENYTEDQGGDTGDGDGNDGGEDPQEIRELSISKDTISFGTITQGDEVSPQSFSLTNEGNVSANIAWDQTETDGVFVLEILSDNGTAVEPGDSLDCQISLKEGDIAPGDYSSTFVFQDEMVSEDVLTLSVSVKIVREEKSSEKTTEGGKPNPDKSSEETTEGGKPNPDKSSEETTEGKEPDPEKPTEKKKTEKDTCTVKAVCSPEEAGYVSGCGTFKKGGKTVLTVFENDGYEFEGWYLDGDKVSEKASLSIVKLQSDKYFTAKFKRGSYKISVKSDNEKYGKVSGGGSYKAGEDALITASPKKGYVFKGWYESDRLVSKDAEYIVEDITANHKFKAVFGQEKPSVKIRVYPRDAGLVTGEGKYKKGSDVRMTAEPYEGYEFRGFILNNKILTTKDEYTLKNVDRDLSVTALFAETEGENYDIVSGVSNKGGIISPSGKLTISEHSTITYSIAPDNGYAILQVEVDGERVGPVNSWTFRDITEDHTIAVAFAPKEGNVNNVPMSKVISIEEAKKVAVAELFPASEDEAGRVSEVITPEMFAVMQEEGTLDEALKTPTQSVVGMKDTGDLGEVVGGYNYDEASALYQMLDITPDEAKEMIETGNDSAILVAAYEAGVLDVLINNQYLVPGNEERVTDVFEENDTIKNMLEFMSGLLTEEEKLQLLNGTNIAVNLGITNGDDMDEEDKKLLEKANAKVEECFYMTVMKQIADGEPQLVTELQRKIVVVLKVPEGSDANCIVRLHDGKVDILEDTDNSPETITIETDRFSPYAFALEEKKASVNGFLIGGAVILLAAVIGIVVIFRKRRETS